MERDGQGGNRGDAKELLSAPSRHVFALSSRSDAQYRRGAKFVRLLPRVRAISLMEQEAPCCGAAAAAEVGRRAAPARVGRTGEAAGPIGCREPRGGRALTACSLQPAGPEWRQLAPVAQNDQIREAGERACGAFSLPISPSALRALPPLREPSTTRNARAVWCLLGPYLPLLRFSRFPRPRPRAAPNRRLFSVIGRTAP